MGPSNVGLRRGGLWDALAALAQARVDERGLAVVWNPTNHTISTTLLAPMYYAGVARARGDVAAMVSVEGGPPTRLPLEAAGDTIPLLVSLAPRALTWFVITAAS